MDVQTSNTIGATMPLEPSTLPMSRSQAASQLLMNGSLEALGDKVNNLIDGVLILTEQRELIYANDNARRVLRQLDTSKIHDSPVPHEIWYVCQSLIHSRSLFPNQHWLIESDIFANDSIAVHVRVRWLQLELLESPCLLLTIEDRYQALKDFAIEEAQKYGLTPREKEVWLLYRTNYSYKQISQELCIAPSTVKKHMRSIHVKQKRDN